MLLGPTNRAHENDRESEISSSVNLGNQIGDSVRMVTTMRILIIECASAGNIKYSSIDFYCTCKIGWPWPRVALGAQISRDIINYGQRF